MLAALTGCGLFLQKGRRRENKAEAGTSGYRTGDPPGTPTKFSVSYLDNFNVPPDAFLELHFKLDPRVGLGLIK